MLGAGQTFGQPVAVRWGGLTDWPENRPEEADRADAAMRSAAAEWLVVEGDRDASRQYFDRWLYDVLRYPRPNEGR